MAYGLSEELTVSARLPYIERKDIRESEEESPREGHAHSHGDSSGLGDILLMGHYRLYKANDLELSVRLGVKAPTGETNDKDDQGNRFETEFQLGTGS